MPEPTNPSSGAGATPGTGSPATGTPASPGATPAQAALTLEEALKKIAELELHASNKTEEATRHGAKLTAAEKELAAYKAAEQAARDAQMSELQKAQKQAAELQEQHDQLAAELVTARVNQDVAKYAGKLNFLVAPDLLAKLIDWEAVEFDDATGKPTNVEKLLEKLAKNAPELVKPAPGQQQQQGAPPIPGMSPDRAAYGRSSIQPPGGRIPGKIPTLDDYFQGKGRP